MFTDAQLDAMLKRTGTTATIDDGSLAGLEIYAKLLDPQTILEEYGGGVELTDPRCKVRTTAINEMADSNASLRGLAITIDGDDYSVKKADKRRSGFTILSLEDA
jgi:hypothetical protein